MKKMIILISIAIFITLPVNVFSGSIWDIFLNKPNFDTLNKLEKIIAASENKCRQDIIPSQMQREKLFKLLDEGNEQAFQAALLVSECLDGGDLEDFYRSSGIFFELRSCVFLEILKNYHITDSQIKYLFVMLPLSTVDNIDLKILMIENRIKLLKDIKEENVEEIKKKGIFFLKEEMKFLKSTKIRQYR